MSETWEQTKARLKKQGIELSQPLVIEHKPVRHEKEEIPVNVKRYNIHKRSLPVGIDTIVVFGVTKEDAEWWVGTKLKTKCYENGADDSKTLIYYDIIPVDATPKEKNIYYNMLPVTTEPIPGFKTPRRIN